MNGPWRLAGLLVAALLLTSCGIFSDEDEEQQPKELVDFKQTLKIKRLWSTKVGGGAEFLRVALRPAGDGSRVYAAGFDGVVTAFQPQTGRMLWKARLSRRGVNASPLVVGDRVYACHSEENITGTTMGAAPLL